MPAGARHDLHQFPPPTATVRARGELAVWEWGDGAPVLLVHGFPDHPLGLESTAKALARYGLRCICPALPGYWPSTAPPDADYSPAAVGGDLLALLDALQLQRVALVGHDWGAELGYPLVSAAPNRFTSFVALATPHPSGYEVRRAIFAELRTAWYAFFLAFAPGAADIAREGSWLTALVNSWSPGFHWDGWPSVRSLVCMPGVMEAVCSYYRCNLESSLDAPVVPVPTTIIHGGQDGCISTIAYSADFEPFFPAGLTRHLIPDVGHWPHLEAPELAVEMIAAAVTRT